MPQHGIKPFALIEQVNLEPFEIDFHDQTFCQTKSSCCHTYALEIFSKNGSFSPG